MPRIRRTVAAGCAVAVLGLTGCDAREIGAAAVVGDERISMAQLQQSVEEVVAFSDGAGPADTAELQRTLLDGMVKHRILDAVAAEQGVEVTPAQVDELLDQLASSQPEQDLTPFLQANGYTEASVRVTAYDALVGNQLLGMLGQQGFQEAVERTAQRLGVVVNPRYGVWDAGDIQAVSGSISEPFAG